MGKYIKYKRFNTKVNGDVETQLFLDELISNGWEIIHYNEEIREVSAMTITIIGGKTQSNIL